MESTTPISQLLSSISYFAGLDAATLATIGAAAARRQVEAGQVAFVEGELCTQLFIVESGYF